MRKFTDFYEAWHWLHEHPAFFAKGRLGPKYPHSRFSECLNIYVVRVDPTTQCIEDDKSRNTKTEVWLKCGAIQDPTPDSIKHNFATEEDLNYGHPTHDFDLDCGGDTFEEAILKLANLVVEHYGDWPPLLEQIARAASDDD